MATTSEQSQSSVSSSVSTHVASYCENKVYIKKITPGSTKISNETSIFLRKVLLPILYYIKINRFYWSQIRAPSFILFNHTLKLKLISHPNLNEFIGICPFQQDIIMAWTFCPKHSLRVSYLKNTYCYGPIELIAIFRYIKCTRYNILVRISELWPPYNGRACAIEWKGSTL